ncbi:Os09g0427550 [Oryza sativa Japonica Group]|uniref:Os09g0427550 protein n=2 Tax=Oryza sativa TaxID=4530 RepID=A0A0P0XME8_ORYSJ|nr:hypothetical protein OsI_31441 [Oryza sativa Indica Group]BAT08184.1 Os09g0427550 [Oryza sativa Japonica Group]
MAAALVHVTDVDTLAAMHASIDNQGRLLLYVPPPGQRERGGGGTRAPPSRRARHTPSPPHNARRFRRPRVLLRHDNDGHPVVEVVDCARRARLRTRS